MLNKEKTALDVWAVALERLSANAAVSEVLYKQWMIPLLPVRLEEDNCLVLGVSDDLIGGFINDSYGKFIAEALRDINGVDYVYKFEAGHQPQAAEESVPEMAVETPAIAPVQSPAARNSIGSVSGSYTFENFVVGEENRYAYAAACRAAEKPGLFNPLYIYGNTGTGKTHLLQAIAHDAQKRYPNMVVRYATCEEILNCYVESLNSHQYGTFRSLLRDADMLLVDDIHVLGGKGHLQEQFFNAFNALYHENKQIILTSDKRPSEIAGLEARLISRFESGVTTEIYAPGLEIRIAILKGMQQDFMMHFEDSILEFIASRISSNVRRLRGALMQLLTRISFEKDTPVTIEWVDSVLHAVFEEEFTSQHITVDEIQKKVAEYFNLRVSDLLSSKRPKSIAEPRMVAMYLARKLTSASFPQIGHAFERNHATIMNAWSKVPELCEKDEELRRAVAVLERQIRS